MRRLCGRHSVKNAQADGQNKHRRHHDDAHLQKPAERDVFTLAAQRDEPQDRRQRSGDREDFGPRSTPIRMRAGQRRRRMGGLSVEERAISPAGRLLMKLDDDGDAKRRMPKPVNGGDPMVAAGRSVPLPSLSIRPCLRQSLDHDEEARRRAGSLLQARPESSGQAGFLRSLSQRRRPSVSGAGQARSANRGWTSAADAPEEHESGVRRCLQAASLPARSDSTGPRPIRPQS